MCNIAIKPCIPVRQRRKVLVEYDTKMYKQRNLVERMFDRLKDWRRIAARYDPCAHTFMSAICIVSTRFQLPCKIRRLLFRASFLWAPSSKAAIH